ncbi:hypothetical protein ACH4Y0_31815 [Streptomyces sp. NPDC020707]|jgi:hypothetical protein|uniref:Uncharacterized protein n=1 Tax=Streptomyces ortus TaxID=2867268 RepID=A0ABT3VAN8_9ACTN|nr:MULTISPECIES: hypothetical protein [Streptomyces]MCX4237009.1 hypothetical protein [Streptomyces ortus]
MTTRNHEHDKHHDHHEHGKHPDTAAGEVLHAAEEAETNVVDDGERRGKDREGADALSPNEGAQDDVQRRDRRDT